MSAPPARTTSLEPRLRRAATIVCITLLAACGGGGGGGGGGSNGPSPAATPQSFSGHYATIESVESTNGVARHQVKVVDTDAGMLVRTYDIVGSAVDTDYPSQDWQTTYQYTVDAGGLGTQHNGVSQLAIIQAGKVMLLDLTGTSVGTARQLSSTLDACTIDRKAVPTNPDGRQAWLHITTAGPDRSCTAAADNLSALIYTDMGTADSAIASGPASGKDVVAALNDTAGLAQGMLVIDRSLPELAVYTNDLKTRLYAVPLPPAHALAASDAARRLIASPTNPRQALVQVGGAVYLADWTGATLALGNAIIGDLRSALANSPPPVAIADAERFYVGDGLKGHGINSRTGQFVVHFSLTQAALGDIVDMALADSGLVVMQAVARGGSGSSASSPRSTLWTVDTATGVPAKLADSSSDTVDHLQSVRGDTVYFSQSGDDSGDLQSLYFTINPTGGFISITPVNNVFGLGIVDQVRNPRLRPDLNAVEQLLLCTPASQTDGIGCANGTLTSRDTATGQHITLGTFAEGSGLVGSRLLGTQQAWTARTGLVQLLRYTTPTNYTSEIWLVNPAQAGSLKLIAQP